MSRRPSVERLPTRLIKHCSEPWLSWIAEGKKCFEGRVRHKDWLNVQVDDRICFWNEQRWPQGIETVVIALHYYKDFGAAFAAHGKLLLPEGADSEHEARAIYANIFDDALVAQHGVVVVQLQTICA